MNSMGANAKQISYFNNIASSSWAFMPIVGMLSDVYLLFGYSKRWYILIPHIHRAVALAFMSFFPVEDNLYAVPFLYFFMYFPFAVLTVLDKKKIIELVNLKPNIKCHLLTFVFILFFTLFFDKFRFFELTRHWRYS
jgi:hypothetical protein